MLFLHVVRDKGRKGETLDAIQRKFPASLYPQPNHPPPQRQNQNKKQNPEALLKTHAPFSPALEIHCLTAKIRKAFPSRGVFKLKKKTWGTLLKDGEGLLHRLALGRESRVPPAPRQKNRGQGALPCSCREHSSCPGARNSWQIPFSLRTGRV